MMDAFDHIDLCSRHGAPRTIRRILQIGDLHIREGELDDQLPVLEFVLDLVAGTGGRERVDLVIVAGDLAGTATPHLSSPAEREALVNWIVELAGQAPVIVMRGNHDLEKDWNFLRHVRNVHWVARPAIVRMNDGADALIAIPYPERGWMLGASGASTSNDLAQAMESAVRTVLAASQLGNAGRRRRIVSAHMNTRGALASTGQPLIGTDFELPVEDLDVASADVVLLNHIHKSQRFRTPKGAVVQHVGSPWPEDFGETEDKFVGVLDLESLDIDMIQTPCVRRVTARLTWAGDRWDGDDVAVDDRTHVRAVLTFHEDERPDVTTIRERFAGARSLTIQRNKIRTRQERAPEVVQASSMFDRWVAFEQSEGRSVDDFDRQVFDEISAG